MITRAGVADLAAIVELERRCFAEVWSEGALLQVLGNPAYLVLVERGEGESPRAYLIGWQVGSDVELARLGVMPEERGQGRGAAMVEAALRIWQTASAQNVWLEVREGNVAARRLYEKRGFGEVGRRPNYYPDGETALVLQLKIA